MLSLVIWFLCVYIVFKGVEIFQIALMSSRDDRRLGLSIGVVMVAASVVVAIVFFFLNEAQAEKMQTPLPNWPR